MENDDHLGILTCSTFTHGVRKTHFLHHFNDEDLYV